ncbi:MAG: hypothetical protein GWN58_01215, partial [Anaerolineae bacterium]|nr:hypothetical protein [Anaerolineae bacterium]
FGEHVLFPNGWGGGALYGLDIPSLGWGIVCVALLYRLQWSILRVIGLSALAGLLFTLTWVS